MDSSGQLGIAFKADDELEVELVLCTFTGVKDADDAT